MNPAQTMAISSHQRGIDSFENFQYVTTINLNMGYLGHVPVQVLVDGIQKSRLMFSRN